MNSTGLGDLEPETAADADAANRVQPVSADAAAHPDPITGEPGAHPIGVGVGALGAGAAGAVIGAVLGPIGAAIGLAFGAVAGGLAGKEVATTSEEAPATLSDGNVEPLSGSLAAGHVPATAESETRMVNDISSPLTTDPQAGEMVYDLSHDDDKPFSASPLPGDELLPAHVPSSERESESFFTNNDSNPIHESELRPLTQTEPPFGLHDSPISKVEPGGDPSVLDIYVKDVDSEESIRTTAYYKYVNRLESGEPGDELADWVQAETEVVGH